MPWLAILLLFAPYLSNFKSIFDTPNNKVGLPNQYNLINYLRYAYDLLDIYLRYAWFITYIFLVFAQDFPDICHNKIKLL